MCVGCGEVLGGCRPMFLVVRQCFTSWGGTWSILGVFRASGGVWSMLGGVRRSL